jgi:hypothetical protein
MWGNIVAINGVLKKKNYKATFSTSSVWKKINSIKAILKKIDKKGIWKNTVARKKSCGETL